MDGLCQAICEKRCAQNNENRIFQSYWEDGLVDVFLGLGLALMGVAWIAGLVPIAATVPVVLMPLWMAARKLITLPRAGYVSLSAERRSKTQHGLNIAGVIGFAIVAALLALNPPGGIVEITVFSGSLYAVCFFPAIVIGLHWRRGSARAVLASIAVGIPVLLIWIVTGLDDHVHEVFPALAASCLTYVLVALMSPAT